MGKSKGKEGDRYIGFAIGRLVLRLFVLRGGFENSEVSKALGFALRVFPM